MYLLIQEKYFVTTHSCCCFLEKPGTMFLRKMIAFYTHGSNKMSTYTKIRSINSNGWKVLEGEQNQQMLRDIRTALMAWHKQDLELRQQNKEQRSSLMVPSVSMRELEIDNFDFVARFNMFQKLNPKDVRVVIMGQEPSPNTRRWDTIAFHAEVGSGNEEEIFPTTQALFRLLKEEGMISKTPTNIEEINKYLNHWSSQGVFFTNCALTGAKPNWVNGNQTPCAHKQIWKEFTTHFIQECSQRGSVLFVLIGNHAQEYKEYIDTNNNKNIIVESQLPTSKHATSVSSFKEQSLGFCAAGADDIFNRRYGINFPSFNRVPIQWDLN